VVFTEKEGLEALPDVIRALETWDTTTIRASTGMYLIAKYIRKHTPKVKVLFSGEGADEICQGYLYFHYQPTAKDGHAESVRLLRDLLYFDVLRCDRSTATHGLEVRVPFLDKWFVEYYMSIPPAHRSPSKEKGEKWLLREAFHEEKLLPHEILWRKKEAFSDGVSGTHRSWHHVIQEQAEKMVTDQDLAKARKVFRHCTPRTKEAYMFRKIFSDQFEPDERAELIPYKWMPKWVGEDLLDPSARELDVYK
jgi:asparagine synthase (glutamine-hydrolysing)